MGEMGDERSNSFSLPQDRQLILEYRYKTNITSVFGGETLKKKDK